jgi:hypothetical protein
LFLVFSTVQIQYEVNVVATATKIQGYYTEKEEEE